MHTGMKSVLCIDMKAVGGGVSALCAHLCKDLIHAWTVQQPNPLSHRPCMEHHRRMQQLCCFFSKACGRALITAASGCHGGNTNVRQNRATGLLQQLIASHHGAWWQTDLPARRRSSTGRAELFVLDGSPDVRGPRAGGPKPASRNGRRKRDLSVTSPKTIPPTAWSGYKSSPCMLQRSLVALHVPTLNGYSVPEPVPLSFLLLLEQNLQSGVEKHR
eukprot:355154-Chlamydomonas_euryale.AAC.1